MVVNFVKPSHVAYEQPKDEIEEGGGGGGHIIGRWAVQKFTEVWKFRNNNKNEK